MQTNYFDISGLTCAACQKLISKRVLKIEGVDNVDVRIDGKTTVIASRQILAEEITKVLDGTHYKVL